MGRMAGTKNGMIRSVPATLKSVWASAVCLASAEPLNAASHAVMVVPMFMPNTVAAAADHDKDGKHGSARALRRVELVLALLAAGAAPVGGEVLEGDAAVLGRVVDVAADGAFG